MHIAIWLLALFVLGLWTLLAWAVGALLGLDPSWVTDIGTLAGQVPFGALIEAWIPGWQALLTATLEFTRTALGWLGGFSQVLVWVLWAVGAVVIVVCAGLLSLLVAVIRRNMPQPPKSPPSAPPSSPAAA